MTEGDIKYQVCPSCKGKKGFTASECGLAGETTSEEGSVEAEGIKETPITTTLNFPPNYPLRCGLCGATGRVTTARVNKWRKEGPESIRCLLHYDGLDALEKMEQDDD